MAQRGEIQCAERQFALQSGRHQKLRKSQTGRYIAEEAHKRLPLFVFPVGLPKASDETRRGAFLYPRFVSVRRVAHGTRTSLILAK